MGTIIVSADGKQLFGCGEHVHGQLGKGPQPPTRSPSSCGAASPSTIKTSSSVEKKSKWKRNLGKRLQKNRQWRTPVSLLEIWESSDLFGDAHVVDVACGQRHSLLLD